MRVRLLKHWNGWKPGRVFPLMGDGAANVLIRRGLATEDRKPAKPTGGKPKPLRGKRSGK